MYYINICMIHTPILQKIFLNKTEFFFCTQLNNFKYCHKRHT